MSAATATPARKKRRPWPFYNILIHRYLGYFFLGTTVVYAISGLAVNHIEDWNPNYTLEKRREVVLPLKDPEDLTPKEALAIFQKLKLDKPFVAKNVFYPDEDTIEVLFSEKEKIRIDTHTWQAEYEQTHRRPALHLFNYLHLNEPKKAWTFYADVYAIALLLLAITGMFMKSGKKGLWGETGLWTLAGMILPVVLVLMYYR